MPSPRVGPRLGIAHSLAGPIIGALVVTFIPEYLRLAREYEPIITSAAIILIIIFIRYVIALYILPNVF